MRRDINDKDETMCKLAHREHGMSVHYQLQSFFFQAEDGIRDRSPSRGSEMCIRDSPDGQKLLPAQTPELLPSPPDLSPPVPLHEMYLPSVVKNC